jgi:hypothetical protein
MRFGVSAGSAVLMTMTTAAAAADLGAYADRDPSDKVGGRVLVTRPCGPHDCPNSARALFRRDGTLLGACFVDSGKRTSVESMGPGWKSRQDAQDVDACGQGAHEFVKRFKAAEAARR